MADIVAAIDTGAYSVPDMLRIMAALSKVPGVSDALAALAIGGKGKGKPTKSKVTA